MVNATSIDITMVTGTFRAIGRMYGPIMPVMKKSGRNEAMTAKVAEMSGGRIPLRIPCWCEGGGLRVIASRGQVLALPPLIRTRLEPEQAEACTGLSADGLYRYRLPASASAPAEFRPVDSAALHRLALAQQMPARVRPPSLALGGEATCYVWEAEWAAEVRAERAPPQSG